MNKKRLSSESFFLLTNESIRLLLYSEVRTLIQRITPPSAVIFCAFHFLTLFCAKVFMSGV